MASAVNQDAYGNPAWGPGAHWGQTAGQPGGQAPGWGNQAQQSGGYYPAGGSQGGGRTWGGPPWSGAPFWHPAGMSRPVAIAFTILGFMFWWPVGLAMLIYALGSGRMGCGGRRRRAMYQAQEGQMNWDGGPLGAWKNWAFGGGGVSRPASSSGNHAFDEYKTETLRRLEEEQKEFGAFLERLRFAKDKAEFDQFMAERRGRPPAPPTEDHPSA